MAVKYTIKHFALLLNELVNKVEKSKLDKALGEYVALLVRHRMLAKANRIIDSFIAIYNEENNEADALISAKHALSSAQKDVLAEELQKKLKIKKVSVTSKIDPSVIGGLKIRVGSLVIDRSIGGSLKQLENYLIKNI